MIAYLSFQKCIPKFRGFHTLTIYLPNLLIITVPPFYVLPFYCRHSRLTFLTGQELKAHIKLCDMLE